MENIKAAKAVGVDDVDVANAAAAKVQAGVRGSRDRKRVQEMKRALNEEAGGGDDDAFPELERHLAPSDSQLQLELSRVKITPLKPLPGSSLRAGSRLQQAP